MPERRFDRENKGVVKIPAGKLSTLCAGIWQAPPVWLRWSRQTQQCSAWRRRRGIKMQHWECFVNFPLKYFMIAVMSLNYKLSYWTIKNQFNFLRYLKPDWECLYNILYFYFIQSRDAGLSWGGACTILYPLRRVAAFWGGTSCTNLQTGFGGFVNLISTYTLWGWISVLSQVWKIPRSLCHPGALYHQPYAP